MNTKDKQLKNLANKIAECTRCKDLAKSQKVFDKDGNSDSPLVFIAEAPGKHEDEQGKPLVEDGNAGKFFANVILKEMKLQRKEVFVCNILCCRPSNKNNPKKDRKPRQDEAEKCQEYLNQTLAIIKPKFICCLGRVAAQNFLETKKMLQNYAANLGNTKDSRWSVLIIRHRAFLIRKNSYGKTSND